MQDLDPITEDRVKKILSERKEKTGGMKAIPQVLVEIRLKHYQDKRRELFRMIREVSILALITIGEIQERYTIMDEAEHGSKMIGGGRASVSGSP